MTKAGATKNSLLKVSGAAVLLVFLASFHPHPELLFEEPAGRPGLPLYVGVFSYLGGVLWIGAGGLAIFAGRFNVGLAQLGWFSVYLGVDDLVMIHDRWLPALIPSYLVEAQPFLFLIYALILAYLLYSIQNLFGPPERRQMALALALLGGSALLDALAEWNVATASVLIEDGLKFVGLVPWAYCLMSLSKKVSPNESPL